MRLIFLIFSIICSTIVAMVSGQIKWISAKYDLGEILESDGKVSHCFSFVNTGDDDVVINRVRASCGCSTASYPRRPIAPGDTAVIKATFDPAGRPGEFNTFFTVLTNVEPYRVMLQLCGKVVGAELTVNEKFPFRVGSLKLNASSVPFGELTEGSTRVATVEAYNDSDLPMKFYVDGEPEYVTVSPRQAVVPPRSVEIIKVEIDTRNCQQRGYVETYFDLFAEPVERTSHAQAGIRRVDVMAIVLDNFAAWSSDQRANAPEISFDTGRLAYVEMDSLSAEPVVRHLTITNHGKSPLRIHSIHSADRCLSVGDYKGTLEKGESTIVEIAVTPNKIDDPVLNTLLYVYSNDPQRAKWAVRIVGTVK